MTNRTWQDNAAEFTALDTGEGWPFARLVACSVEKDAGHGKRAVRHVSGKVSGTAFAEAAGCSPHRVLRYLEGWDEAARRGWVPAASTLTPESVLLLTDPDHPWGDVAPRSDESLIRLKDREPQFQAAADAEGVALRQVARVAGSLPAVAAAIRADPKVAAAAARSLVANQSDVLAEAYLEHEHAKTAKRRQEVADWKEREQIKDRKDRPPGQLASAMGELGIVLALGAAISNLQEARDKITLAGGVSDDALEDVARDVDSIEVLVREIRVLVGTSGFDAGLQKILGGE